MNRPLIVGIAGGIIVLAAIALTFFIDREPDRPVRAPAPVTSQPATPQTTAPQPATPGSTGAQSSSSQPSGASPGEARPTPSTPSTATPSGTVSVPGANAPSGSSAPAAPQPSKASQSPSFDIVRVNPQGDTVIAGRALPNADVTVLLEGKVIGRVRADRRGEWVLIPEKPIAPGTHNLTIVARNPDGTELSSQQGVVVVVPEKGKDVAGGAVARPAGSLAVSVPKEGSGAPVVLQAPKGVGDAALSLDAIDYGSAGGNVGLSGRAPPGAEVRIYLNNRFIGRAIADEKGIWRLSPDTEIPPGLYTMRVDRVDADGKVMARVELPFSRAVPVTNLAEGKVVFVQPGNSLWRIARRTYGQGLRYTEIFEANKDQIRNPDLIYPGQVFVLPESNARGG